MEIKKNSHRPRDTVFSADPLPGLEDLSYASEDKERIALTLGLLRLGLLDPDQKNESDQALSCD
jgi:hypothetical protein